MKAYLVAGVKVTDQEVYESYKKGVPATVAAFGGRFIVRGGKMETLEGTWTPQRLIILEFPDMAKLRMWYDSSEYHPLLELRQRSALSNVVAIEGI
ncbi:MAG: DUF1330 domain-containing protein [Casimicrobiaceae bacterium]